MTADAVQQSVDSTAVDSVREVEAVLSGGDVLVHRHEGGVAKIASA